MNTISYINLIQNISASSLSLEEMNFICKTNKIEPIEVKEEQEEIETI